jgi:integrase/recombinase XerD
MGDHMTLLHACERFVVHCETEKNLSKLTVRAYQGDLNCFVSIIGASCKLHDFSESWIERAVQKWSADPALKATTVKRRTACVKVFVRWLFRRRFISFNPLERIHLEIKIPKRLPRNLLTDEIRQLIVAKPESMSANARSGGGSILSRSEWDKLTARVAIEVLCLTGVRVGELVKIRQSDIDHNLRQVLVLGKGNRERHVSFPDDITTSRLQSYREYANLGFGQQDYNTFFLNGLGRPANEQYIRRVIRTFAKDTGLTRRVTPHMLRHTAATQLLEAGLDIRFVQRLLGHASITTTEIYTHVADHVLRAEISRANVRERLELHR